MISQNESSSSKTVKPRHEPDLDDTDLDADDEFVQASPRKGRGMSMEYSKVANLTDYNRAKEFMRD